MNELVKKQRGIQIEIGQKFGHLEVILEGDKKRYSGYTSRVFICRCVCGIEKQYFLVHLMRGRSRSCGCKKASELFPKPELNTGNASDHPLYSIYINIKARCYNKNRSVYKYYGAVGIKMCNEWRLDAQKFIDWAVNNGWKPGLTVDRFPDKAGDYCPENCRWVTMQQQANNRKGNVVLEYNGETKTLAEFSMQYGFKYSQASYQVRKWGKSMYDLMGELPLNKNYLD